ncbi:MAG: hypothetical protein ACKOAD_02155 [Gammaproteobacteria bacterium]
MNARLGQLKLAVFYHSSLLTGMGIFNEVRAFTESNTGSLVINISDESMSPLYCLGDYVGGLPIVSKLALKYKSQLFIVKPFNEPSFVRYLDVNEENLSFIFKAHNKKFINLTYPYEQIEKLYYVVYYRKNFSL